MAFDDENESGNELEDFGEELSSEYREEEEEGPGEEGEDIEEEAACLPFLAPLVGAEG